MVQLPFPEWLPTSEWRVPEDLPDISRCKEMSVDIEAKDPNLQARGPGFIRGDAHAVGVAVCTEDFCGYFPVRHASRMNLAPNVVFRWLADQAKYFDGELFGANLLYDLEGLWHDGVRFRDSVKFRDIQIAEPLIDEETADGYSLEVQAKKYLGVGKDEYLLKEAAARHTKGYKDKRAKRPIPFDPKGDLWRLGPEYVGAYAEEDVRLPRKIFKEHQAKILDKEDLWEIYNLEASLIPILLQMRLKGIAVDLEKAEGLKKLLTVEIDRYSLAIKRLVGFDPNVDSGPDMLKAYEKLNFMRPEFNIVERLRYTKPTAKHPTGQASFTAEWYSTMNDPLSSIVQKKKKLMTLRDDFVVGDIIKESIRGRIHCQFHQLREDEGGTRSGRMASRNPNLQQVPARHDDGLWGEDSPKWADEVRKLFVADSGMLYCKSDVSQQEPRMLIHFAAKCRLGGADLAVAAFRKNPRTDYHVLTTNIVNERCGRNYKRKQIKAVTLGAMYGMGIKKLCRMLQLSEQESKEILSAYHEAIPFVRGLSSKAMATAQDRGYILTIRGRRRRFQLWEPIPTFGEDREQRYGALPLHLAQQRWPGRRLQRAGVHKALNALIQGSSADQTKTMMFRLYYEFGKVPHLQVHDELGFSVADHEEARLVKKVMEEAILLEIPVVCDAMLGPSWGGPYEPVEVAA